MKALILDRRSRLNVRQEDLAKMIGISHAAVNRWENGHSFKGIRFCVRGFYSR